MDLGGIHAALDNGTYVTERWETPENLFDDQATLIWDVAIDHRGTETAMVYVAVPRVGVKKLEFDPEAPAGSRLKDMGVIQTADYTSGVYVRVGEGGTRHLVVYDHGGGIRVYGE